MASMASCKNQPWTSWNLLSMRHSNCCHCYRTRHKTLAPIDKLLSYSYLSKIPILRSWAFLLFNIFNFLRYFNKISVFLYSPIQHPTWFEPKIPGLLWLVGWLVRLLSSTGCPLVARGPPKTTAGLEPSPTKASRRSETTHGGGALFIWVKLLPPHTSFHLNKR